MTLLQDGTHRGESRERSGRNPRQQRRCRCRHCTVQQLAGELDVDYIDLNTGKNRAQIDWSTDTFDGGDHLNLNGAKKATAKLGELLQDRYYLPDHSGESAYRSWDEAYARYERVVNEGAAS